MPTTIKVGPVTRIEGHLDIEAAVDASSGPSQVVSATSAGTMFRGFEIILAGRNPLDAPHLTQRICGVCPTSHGMASSMALEAAMKIAPPDNGRLLRNLILGSDFLQSHILHFYQLAALDYIDTTGLLDQAPWTPRYIGGDLLTGAVASALKDHYVQALAVRRQAHQMGAIFGGKMPCSPRFGPGGCTEAITTKNVSSFRSLLSTVTWFIRDIYIPDVELLATKFPRLLEDRSGMRQLARLRGVRTSMPTGRRNCSPGDDTPTGLSARSTRPRSSSTSSIHAMDQRDRAATRQTARRCRKKAKRGRTLGSRRPATWGKCMRWGRWLACGSTVTIARAYR